MATEHTGSTESESCHRFEVRVPAGDDRPRHVCRDCGYVEYRNPKVVVGAVVVADGRVLLCRRAIEPARGAWTLPAGHLELGETTEEGAAREAWEEARARIEIADLLGAFTDSEAGVVHLFYRARLEGSHCAPGPESLEVRWFAWDEIPWGELAFPADGWSLLQARPLPEDAVTSDSEPQTPAW